MEEELHFHGIGSSSMEEENWKEYLTDIKLPYNLSIHSHYTKFSSDVRAKWSNSKCVSCEGSTSTY